MITVTHNNNQLPYGVCIWIKCEAVYMKRQWNYREAWFLNWVPECNTFCSVFHATLFLFVSSYLEDVVSGWETSWVCEQLQKEAVGSESSVNKESLQLFLTFLFAHSIPNLTILYKCTVSHLRPKVALYARQKCYSAKKIRSSHLNIKLVLCNSLNALNLETTQQAHQLLDKSCLSCKIKEKR